MGRRSQRAPAAAGEEIASVACGLQGDGRAAVASPESGAAHINWLRYRFGGSRQRKCLEADGWPKAITVDNGTEFTSKALDDRAWQREIKLDCTRKTNGQWPARVVQRAAAR